LTRAECAAVTHDDAVADENAFGQHGGITNENAIADDHAVTDKHAIADDDTVTDYHAVANQNAVTEQYALRINLLVFVYERCAGCVRLAHDRALRPRESVDAARNRNARLRSRRWTSQE